MHTHASPPAPRAEKSPGLVRVSLATEHLAGIHLQATGEWLFALADGLDGDRLELDLAGVRYLASESLGKLVSLHTRVRHRGGRLVVTVVTPLVREVFEVTHLNRVLDVRRGACEGAAAGTPCDPNAHAMTQAGRS